LNQSFSTIKKANAREGKERNFLHIDAGLSAATMLLLSFEIEMAMLFD
jgi:hypothetical protein